MIEGEKREASTQNLLLVYRRMYRYLVGFMARLELL